MLHHRGLREILLSRGWPRRIVHNLMTYSLLPAGIAAPLRSAAAAQADRYQGERLNFESPGVFFGRLTERRWALVAALQGQGAMAVRELALRIVFVHAFSGRREEVADRGLND